MAIICSRAAWPLARTVSRSASTSRRAASRAAGEPGCAIGAGSGGGGLGKAVQTAFGEAENALVQLESDRRRVDLLQDGEARARRAYEASRKGYAAGFVDLQTTLDNERAWRTVRTLKTAAQVQALRRAVQTYKALGGGWPLETAPTNKEAR